MTTLHRLRAPLLAAVLSLTALVLLPMQAPAQIAVGQSKFLGSTISTSTPTTFTKYWNQVTPENANAVPTAFSLNGTPCN